MKQAANALRWCVAEMERRYALMAGLGVRHLSSYNKKVSDAIAAGTPIRDPTYKPEMELDQVAPADSRPHLQAGEGARSSRARASDDAVHRRHHRRACRHDDDGRQEGRRAD